MPEPDDREPQRGAMMASLSQELRWLSAYSVLFSHLLARRAGIHSTDLEAHDVLTLAGPLPAGQLAALTGLTSGAVTTLVDRLERAGLAHREPDPGDRRRVIVRALPPPEAISHQIMPEFQQMGEAMDEVFASYEATELALILTFLERARAVAAARVAALGGGPPSADRDTS